MHRAKMMCSACSIQRVMGVITIVLIIIITVNINVVIIVADTTAIMTRHNIEVKSLKALVYSTP